MSSYRIVCVNTEHPHRHIVAVGTSSGYRWTVEQVRQALANGDHFYTVSSAGKEAAVRPDNCRINGCTVQTIRSAADAIPDNNLDNLPACR